MTMRDIGWTFSFVGTSIGAGILLLPIKIGSTQDLYSFLAASFIVFFMTFLSQKLFAKVIIYSDENLEFNGVVKKYLGTSIGSLLSILYFIVFMSVLVVYATSLKGDLLKFFSIFMVLPSFFSTSFFSLIMIIFLVLLVSINEKIFLNAMGIITFILLFLIIGVSLYLLPYWQSSYINDVTHFKFRNISKIVPIVAFGFLYFTTISNMIFRYKEKNIVGKELEKKVNKTLIGAQLILSILTVLFVLSSIFVINHKEIMSIKDGSATIMTLIANIFDLKILKVFSLLITICALITSFLGVFLATKDSLSELIKGLFKFFNKKNDNNFANKYSKIISIILITLLCYTFILIAFSPLDIIGAIIVPVLAIIVFIFPFAIHSIQKKNGHLENDKTKYFVFISGLLLIIMHYLP